MERRLVTDSRQTASHRISNLFLCLQFIGMYLLYCLYFYIFVTFSSFSVYRSVFIHCFVVFFSFFLTERKKICESFWVHKSLSIQELLPMSTRLYDCYNFPPCCSLEHLSRAQLKWRCFGENWRHQSSGSSSFCLLWLAVTPCKVHRLGQWTGPKFTIQTAPCHILVDYWVYPK